MNMKTNEQRKAYLAKVAENRGPEAAEQLRRGAWELVRSAA